MGYGSRPAARIAAASARPHHGASMYIDEFKQQLPDLDPAETDDWIESLDQVVGGEGEVRARFLLYKLLKRAW